MHAALLARLPLEAILVCYHDDPDGCDCRKPRPGLLLEAAERYRINLRESVMVGDRWKDIEAGRRAGCATVLLGDGWGEPAYGSLPDYTADLDGEAAEWILSERRVGEGEHRDGGVSVAGQGLRGRGRSGRDGRAVPASARPGIHDEPDADAEGRRRGLPGVCPRRARAHPGPPDLVRGVRRRVPRDAAPGARDRVVGPARVRQDPDHQHARRVVDSARAGSRRAPGSRSTSPRCSRSSRCATSPRPSAAARPRTRPCSPGGSPTPGATRCR